MAEHRKSRSPLWRSRRLRAVLSLGIVAVALVTGTYAYWTDDFVGQVGGNDYLNENDGLTYGMQMEVWW